MGRDLPKVIKCLLGPGVWLSVVAGALSHTPKCDRLHSQSGHAWVFSPLLLKSIKTAWSECSGG